MKKTVQVCHGGLGIIGLPAPPRLTTRFAAFEPTQSTGPTFPRYLDPKDNPLAVSWMSFDGDTYWVRLSVAQGWPRSIRITQSDVDGARN